MSEAFVFTFKDGLLSPLAHDLKLRVTKLEIGEKRATFDASSLRVESAGGLGHLLYGSNFPHYNADAPAALDRLGLSPADRRRVLHDNAREVFKLSG